MPHHDIGNLILECSVLVLSNSPSSGDFPEWSKIQINFPVMFNKCISYNHWYLIRCPGIGLWFSLMLLMMIKGSDYWLLSQWITPSGNKYSVSLNYTVICVEVRDWRNSIRKSVSDLQKRYITEIAFSVPYAQVE